MNKYHFIFGAFLGFSPCTKNFQLQDVMHAVYYPGISEKSTLELHLILQEKLSKCIIYICDSQTYIC